MDENNFSKQTILQPLLDTEKNREMYEQRVQRVLEGVHKNLAELAKSSQLDASAAQTLQWILSPGRWETLVSSHSLRVKTYSAYGQIPGETLSKSIAQDVVEVISHLSESVVTATSVTGDKEKEETPFVVQIHINTEREYQQSNELTKAKEAALLILNKSALTYEETTETLKQLLNWGSIKFNAMSTTLLR